MPLALFSNWPFLQPFFWFDRYFVARKNNPETFETAFILNFFFQEGQRSGTVAYFRYNKSQLPWFYRGTFRDNTALNIAQTPNLRR